MNLVSFYSVPRYDISLCREAIEKIIQDHGGFERLFQKGKKVVIKPNLVVKKSPEGCATTHPAILEALFQILLPHTKDILVAECPGGPNTELLLKGIYRETGILEVCEKYSIPIEWEMKAVTRDVKNPVSCPQIDILESFDKADVLINLAKMKTHSLTTITGSAKNLYGTIPGLKKVEYHARFPELRDFAGLVVDINKAIVPTLSIIDGIWGMEKEGPSGGVPKFGGALFGGTSTHALDLAMCDFMGIDRAIVPILNRAIEEKVFDGTYTLCGDDMERNKPEPFILPDSRKKFILKTLPTLFGGRLYRYLSPRPKINSQKCRGCGECARLCPQRTIEMKNHKAKIKTASCIRCYCCQEMCPFHAVETKGRWFLR